MPPYRFSTNLVDWWEVPTVIGRLENTACSAYVTHAVDLVVGESGSTADQETETDCP